jgi:hypothetical protein
MCCFSGRVERVSGTRIFARAAADGAQYLVYELTLSARDPVAMILPLPVPPGSPEHAVRFIDLSGYRDFFTDLERGFPEPVGLGGPLLRAAAPQFLAQSLRVVEVGDFEASFVPTVADFARLDARFRLPDTAWDALPGYRDYGFAVFKLKPGARAIHPMAFAFPRRDRSRLFFPTVHVHDGAVHEGAHFDHSIYCQLDAAAEGGFTRPTWRLSDGAAQAFMRRVAAEPGLVDLERRAFRCQLHGMYRNEDVWV